MVSALNIGLAAASFGPAIALMLFTLQNYTYPKVEKPFFDDRRVFGLFAFGIVLGMIFFFIDVATSPTIAEATIMIAIAVPALQGLIKLAILNWPKLQRRVDTAFYGLALGLGISTTYAFARMYFLVANQSLVGLEEVDWLYVLIVVNLGVQIVFIQGSTTAMIGVGCARGQPWAYFGNSMLYALAYSLLFFGSSMLGDYIGEAAAIGVLLAAWVVCIYSYYHVHKIDYPVLIEDAKRGLMKKLESQRLKSSRN